ncbi:hypothetical protein ACEQ8H_008150 [Pleosporales sp. CAS-2024a]
MSRCSPSKRPFESAFSSAPGVPVSARRGVDAQPQPPCSPLTPSALSMPGQWPPSPSRESSPARLAPDAVEQRPSVLFTFARWAFATALHHALALPARLTGRFGRQQQVIVQPVVREDGAQKRRIIDAGPADAPTTPTPAPRAATHWKRRGRNAGRADYERQQWRRWSPAQGAEPAQSPSTPEQESETHSKAPDQSPTSPDIWFAAPTPPRRPVRHVPQQESPSMVCLTTHTPVTLAQLLPQQESPKPVDTASTPPPAQTSIFSCTTPPWIASLIKKRSTALPAPTSIPFPNVEVAAHALQDAEEHIDMMDIDEDSNIDHDDDQDSNIDHDDDDEDSDWSFEGAWTSPTPADQPADYRQPLVFPNVIHLPLDNTTELNASVGTATNEAASPYLEVPRRARAAQQSARDPHQISPNSHLNILECAKVTPLRKMLLKNIVSSNLAIGGSLSVHANHTVPSPSYIVPQSTELQQMVYQASVLKTQAAEVAHRAHQASEQYKAIAEARQNNVPDVTAAEQEYYNFTETIDQDLSFLSDAWDEDEDEQISTPSPPRNKSVRWSSHASAKTFYYDTKVADMMDATLESIRSSPYRSPRTIYQSDSDTSGDEAAKASPTRARNDDTSSPQSDSTPAASAGFRGVPASTWDDSDDESLQESQISIELLEELQKDVQKKLALAPPAPAAKALVTPISLQEMHDLEAVAVKTNHGKIRNATVVKGINAYDFSTLLPDQFSGDSRAWLNDSIVNEYIGVLVASVKKEAGFTQKRNGPAPPVHAFSSFWYPTFKDKKFEGVKRWSEKLGLTGWGYLQADLLLYPICETSHWRLLAVKPKERTIEYLDSLGGSGCDYIKTLKEYLALELKEFWDEKEWTVQSKQRSTRQKNGNDCGVFALLNALALLRGEDFDKVIASNGMLEARQRIATTLLAGKPTSEFT